MSTERYKVWFLGRVVYETCDKAGAYAVCDFLRELPGTNLLQDMATDLTQVDKSTNPLTMLAPDDIDVVQVSR